jgi:hypothetical protein
MYDILAIAADEETTFKQNRIRLKNELALEVTGRHYYYHPHHTNTMLSLPALHTDSTPSCMTEELTTPATELHYGPDFHGETDDDDNHMDQSMYMEEPGHVPMKTVTIIKSSSSSVAAGVPSIITPSNNTMRQWGEESTISVNYAQSEDGVLDTPMIVSQQSQEGSPSNTPRFSDIRSRRSRANSLSDQSVGKDMKRARTE